MRAIEKLHRPGACQASFQNVLCTGARKVLETAAPGAIPHHNPAACQSQGNGKRGIVTHGSHFHDPCLLCRGSQGASQTRHMEPCGRRRLVLQGSLLYTLLTRQSGGFCCHGSGTARCSGSFRTSPYSCRCQTDATSKCLASRSSRCAIRISQSHESPSLRDELVHFGGISSRGSLGA